MQAYNGPPQGSTSGRFPYPPPFLPPPPSETSSAHAHNPYSQPPPGMPPGFGLPWQNSHFPPRFLPPPLPSWNGVPPFTFMSPPSWSVSRTPPRHILAGQGKDYYQSAKSVMPPSMGKVKSETQADADKKWMMDFVQNCEQNRTASKFGDVGKERTRSITISGARELHCKAYRLLTDLESIKAAGELSAEIQTESQSLQMELDSVLVTLSDETLINALAKQVRKRRNRRNRSKECRKNQYLEKCKIEKNHEDKQKDVENWLHECRENEQRRLREKEVQKQLDQCLQEVRQKRTKLTKSLDLINALAKLRKIRKESAIKKGLQPSDDNDENFQRVHKSAKERLALDIATCNEEETRLRLFLDGERKEEEAKLRRQRKKEDEEKLKQWSNARSQILFGTRDELEEMNPMWPIQELHKQAEISVLALVGVRQQWDRFISTEHRAGSKMPLNWVEPAAPVSDSWGQYIVE